MFERRNPRFCPKTGKMLHRFDATTHRCACGRWERGFKPKAEKVNARDRGECQICEGKFSMLGGKLGHHGYKRPGCGYIVGDCMGVAHAPYPATDALVKYRKVLEGRLVAVKEDIAYHRSPALRGIVMSRKLGFGFDARSQTVVSYTLLRDARAVYSPHALAHPSFKDALKCRVAALENEASWYRHDIQRVDARIAAAKKS